MDKFEQTVRKYGPRLCADLNVDILFAAATFGNGGHESNGFATLQEINPVIAGSRGGFGWFQWTGPRRRAFETFCKRKGMNPNNSDANYAFLLLELRGPEKLTIAKVKAAITLEDKVKAFELAYERAGVKHYPSRITYAKRALAVLQSGTAKQVQVPVERPVIVDMPGLDKPMLESKTSWLASAGAALSSATAFLSGLHPVVQGIIVVAGIGVAVWIIRERYLKARSYREAAAKAAAQ